MAADDPRIPDESDPPDSLTELAARIADGSSIDWPAGGIDRATSLDPATVEELKAIAAIADLRRLTADEGTDPAAARTWGSLTIVGRIGAGQFGEVFRAWDPKLQREVALKLLRTPDSQDPLAPSRAIGEARHLARVRHRNVLTVYGADQIGNDTGIWTELIEGETLELLVAKHGPVSESSVLAIGLDLCRALAAVHGAGIVHRDVKAQNVMREVGGRVVLMDFGTGIDLSRAEGRPRDLSGTPLYLAPELLAGAPPNASTDLYALSVLLFHLLTGDYPVPGATLDEIRANHASGNRRRFKDLAPTVSEAVGTLVDRSLTAEPENRLQTAEDLERGLLAIIPSTPSPFPVVDSRWSGSRWFLTTVVAAAVVAVLWPYFNVRTKNHAAELACDPCDAPGVQIGGAAVSPDGRWLAMADTMSGDLLIRDLRTNTIRPLGLPAALPVFAPSPNKPGFSSSPVFFADSKRLAFVWRANSRYASYQIWTVDIFARDPRLVSSSSGFWPGIYDVAPDGKSVLVIRGHGERQRGGEPVYELAWVSLDGVARSLKAPWGKTIPLDGSTSTTEFPQAAQVSPDGRHIAYEWEPENGPVPGRRVHHIYLMKSDGSEQRGVVVTEADNANPIWSSDGNRLFFTSDVSGTMDLWSIAVQDGAAVGGQKLVRSDFGKVNLLAISPGGRVHFLKVMPPRRDYIFIIDTAMPVINPDQPTIHTTVAGTRPSWSDDGTVMRFLRVRSPLNARLPFVAMMFTVADGREVVDQAEASEMGFWSYPLVGGLPRKTLVRFVNEIVRARHSYIYGPAAPTSGYLSRSDGMEIALVPRLVGPLLYAFRSDSTSTVRVSAIVAIDVAADTIRPVCELPNRPPGRDVPGAVGLALSPDGGRLALALWRDGHATLGLLEISSCSYRQVYGPYPTQETFNKVGWSPDGKAILISQEVGDARRTGYQILKIPVAGGKPEQLIRLNGTDRFTSFAISIGGMLAVSPNPAFDQSFAPGTGTAFQVWRLDLGNR